MKYILTSEKLEGKILFEFGSNGILMAFKIDENDANEKLVKWVLSYLPLFEKSMSSDIFKKFFKVEKVHDDLSFKAFWEEYNYKVGNKARTNKLWDALTEPERAQAISSAIKYRRYLATKQNMEQAYAETWLRQRRFENQYL